MYESIVTHDSNGALTYEIFWFRKKPTRGSIETAWAMAVSMKKHFMLFGDHIEVSVGTDGVPSARIGDMVFFKEVDGNPTLDESTSLSGRIVLEGMFKRMKSLIAFGKSVRALDRVVRT